MAGVTLRGAYVCAEKETQVGGDWYDAFHLPDGRILFSIGDVAGHGIEAAVVMTYARQAIIAAAIDESDPAMVLERTNRAILLQDAKMVTAICGFVDTTTFETVYSTAGHPAPILVGPGLGARYLPQSGVPLGVFTECDYQRYVIKPQDGDATDTSTLRNEQATPKAM